MKNVDIQIRNAAFDDAPVLAKLGARTFYEAFAADSTPENMDEYISITFSQEQLEIELANDDAHFLLALTDEGRKPIGYAKLIVGDHEACITGRAPIELERLYVLHNWIGHGVGQALMLACLDKARQDDHDTIWLGVWEQNPRAINFYKEWGFKTVGTHIFHLGKQSHTDLLMQRPLTAEPTNVDTFLESFRYTLEKSASKLESIGDKEAAKRPSAEAWSAKQILGHLIDSAVNNHRRFVEAQLKEDLVFEGYAQESWVTIQQYQNEAWQDLVSLWKYYNWHLYRLISVIPDEQRYKPRHPHTCHQICLKPFPETEFATLDYLICDYLAHINAHLEQIFDFTIHRKD